MSVTVEAFFKRVRDQLIDTKTNKRYLDGELLNYLNDALQLLSLYQPSAFTEKVSVALAQGAEQQFTSEHKHVVEFYRNTSGSGLRSISRRELDDEDPNWYVGTQSKVVRYVMYTGKDPKRCWVYPPNDGTGSLDVLMVKNPVELTINDSVALSDDSFVAPLVDEVLSRCYTKDSDYAGNVTMSQFHHGRFMEAVGQKEANLTIADTEMNPLG